MTREAHIQQDRLKRSYQITRGLLLIKSSKEFPHLESLLSRVKGGLMVHKQATSSTEDNVFSFDFTGSSLEPSTIYP